MAAIAPDPSDLVSQQSTVEERELLADASKYAWFGDKHKGLRAHWKALRLDREQLDDQEEQLRMALDVFEKACMLVNFTLFDLVAFSEIDQKHSQDFDYCTRLVSIVQLAVISNKTLLDNATVTACCNFMKNTFTAIESNTTEDGYLDIGDGVKRLIPRQFRSRENMLTDYTGTAGLSYLTKFLPGDFVSQCSREVCDPFGQLESVEVNEKLIKHLAIVHWALFGYAAVMRLCLTAEQIRYGKAADDSDGEKVDAFFAKHGVVLNHVSEHGEAIFGTPAFQVPGGPPYMQVFDASSSDERHVLPSPASVRTDFKNSACAVSIDVADDFRAKWRSYTAYYGQQVMRARYFELVSASRRELVYITRIKELQDKALSKGIAIGVTLGITLGQFSASCMSNLLFKNDDKCLNVCAAG